ncbi:hypothetical protein PHPALM_29745 [Phytophthora palmivora]|uniref:Uncharacterized protein n=1 Tax=Phytophthora palmivora TaxID=4796 RepID=A0A2P4X6S8_9STRA|nr:hypothetical protein PHPALM_29745 [Phytophthora palmivora]
MEGLRQQSKSSAQDERGYGSINPGTVHRKAAKKPRTTYVPAVADPKSQSLRAVNPEPVFRGNPATSLAAGASQSAAADPLHMVVELAVPVKEGRRSSRTRLSTRLLLSRILLDPQLRVGTLWGPC